MSTDRFINIFKTFFSIILINTIIIYSKLKKKKIIFFYHPGKKSTLIHLHYLDNLFSYFEKDYVVIHGHELIDYYNKNFFFVSHSFLIRWIFNIDIFFSLNVCDKFPKKSKNVYMHHDISTAPLVENEKEKELYERLLNYDFIFVPDKKSLSMFKNFFLNNEKNKNIKIPEIFCVGYFKLDYLIERFKHHTNLEKQIVIAPSDYRHISELSIFNSLKDIIKILLDKTDFKIIFRPHPANRNSSKVLEIKKEFINKENFFLDFSDDYYDIYSNSACLITDISGTAFTYAYMTQRPIIFFSKINDSLDKFSYSKLDYFKDRKKIGLIAKSPEDVLKNVSQLEHISNEIKNTNKELLKKIDYLGESKKRIKTLVDKIVA